MKKKKRKSREKINCERVTRGIREQEALTRSIVILITAVFFPSN